MKDQKNSVLRVILTFILSISLASVFAPAANANGSCYSVVNGVLTDGHACTDAVVIDDSVRTIGDYAFSLVAITSVVIPDSVETIGYGAFTDITSLTSVTIGNSVRTIGENAFYYTTALTSINIPNSVISIGESAFDSAENLTSLTLGNSVRTIGENAFAGTGLMSVTIPASVTSIGDGAFSYITSLTSVTIGNSVRTIGEYAFAGTGLMSVTIPASVTSIHPQAFMNSETLLTFNFLGNAPTVLGDTFQSVALNAKAYVQWNATGFEPLVDSKWKGLIVVVGSAPVSSSGSSTPSVNTPTAVKSPDLLLNSKANKSLSKRDLKKMLDKKKAFKNYPLNTYKYSIFRTSKKTCAIKGNFVVALKKTGACEMYVTRTTAKGAKTKYWVKIDYAQ